MGEGIPLKHTKTCKGGGRNCQFFNVHSFWMSPISIACFLREQIFKSYPDGFFVNMFKCDWFNSWSFLKWYSFPLLLLQKIKYKARIFQFFKKNKNLEYKLNAVSKTNAKAHTVQTNILIYFHFNFKGDTAVNMLWITVD